jgi:hypothetical protein
MPFDQRDYLTVYLTRGAAWATGGKPSHAVQFALTTSENSINSL